MEAVGQPPATMRSRPDANPIGQHQRRIVDRIEFFFRLL